MPWVSRLAAAAIGAAFALCALGAWAAPARHPILQVTLAASVSAPHGGRLLIFAQPVVDALAKAKGGPIEAVGLGAKTRFRFIPGRTHFNLHESATSPGACSRTIRGKCTPSPGPARTGWKDKLSLSLAAPGGEELKP